MLSADLKSERIKSQRAHTLIWDKSKSDLVSLCALIGISSGSALKCTHLKIPSLCFKGRFTMCDHFERTQVRRQPHKKQTGMVEVPSESHIKVSGNFSLYPSGGFCFPFIMYLLYWEVTMSMFSVCVLQTCSPSIRLTERISERMFDHFCVAPSCLSQR